MTDQDPAIRRPHLQRRAEERRRRNQLVGVCLAVIAALGVVVVLLDGDHADEVAAQAGATVTTPEAAVAAATTDRPGDAVAQVSTTVPTTTLPPTTVPPTTVTTAPPDDALPPSGEGRRVVFSIDRQRMWWVDHDGTVLRTALVSGRERTPQTGTFQVFSKSLNATGLDGSRMDYFVRFTHGPNGWAIGFHDIPVVDGQPVQTDEELGQPLSAGCIRQATEDAVYTWEFLEVGDTVVVVD